MSIDVRAAVTVEELALADTLATLTEDQWEHASLCEGWTVREVVAHLCLGDLHRAPAVVLGFVRARGDANRAFDRFARRDAARPTAELVELVRANATSSRTPPGGGFEGRLVHTVVHSLDIRRPLGLGHDVSPDAMALVLDTITSPKSQRFFADPLAGFELQATDLDWSHGAGPVRRGRAADLVLALAGRPVADGSIVDPQAPATAVDRPTS